MVIGGTKIRCKDFRFLCLRDLCKEHKISEDDIFDAADRRRIYPVVIEMGSLSYILYNNQLQEILNDAIANRIIWQMSKRKS